MFNLGVSRLKRHEDFRQHIVLEACHRGMTTPTKHSLYHRLVFNQQGLPWMRLPAQVTKHHAHSQVMIERPSEECVFYFSPTHFTASYSKNTSLHPNYTYNNINGV